MKKITSIILTTIFVFGIFAFPLKANAANSDSKVGTVSISSGTLNVRSKASTSGSVLHSLKKGGYITLVSKTGSWWYVEYAKGKYGYCHADYIKTITGSAKKVNITSGTLNVRKGAGTSYSKVASLTKNEIVLVLNTSNDWSHILYHGTKLGYVSSKYLASSATTYKSVSLKVPSFKQTDSRWSSVKIGSSGKTIAQIGCATTAIAMIESYREGKNIYPDAMSKKLKYTSSGSVYWPSHYIAVTSSSNYLTAIYNQLLAGKPVLFGAKNSKGGQHWVVITGFKGGSSLKTDLFTINDPGSNTRTTLDKFLKEYTTFYKYFYYN